jgi:threonine-phosphate decarboxylase
MEIFEHGGDIYANPGVTLDFSVNTNPLGMPPEVRQALVSRVDEFSLYPDPKCRELCAAIASRENVPADWVLCGNGAADLIYRLCYAVKPREALVCAPTFSEYERALSQSGCRVSRYVLTEENGFALTEGVLEYLTPGVDILFLCHPNNPTGRLIPRDLLERILDRARQIGAIAVADECFLDFTDGESSKSYLWETPGLVVLKAFTKIYAMAGLRLGYMLTSGKTLLEKANAASQCWSVSTPAQIAGAAALGHADWARETRLLIAEERAFLSGELTKLGVRVFQSDANYLLLRCEKPLYEPLLAKGIMIRRCGNFIGLDTSYYRIAVKTRPENERFSKTLHEVING